MSHPWFDLEPVVVIGMHRSGTSLLARILDRCGLFMGADVQGNHESLLFMQTNDRLFGQCFSTWSHPFGVHLACLHPAHVEHLAAEAKQVLEGSITRYFGSSPPEGGTGLGDIGSAWGWKDPRNTFTLPVWRALFPKLKVIHIKRHGMDAAQSLYVRDWQAYHAGQPDYLSALTVARDNLGLTHSRHGWTLAQSFALWEEYTEKAQEQVTALGERALDIRYEDLLTDSVKTVDKILDFCGLATQSLPGDLADSLKPDRAYAYRHEPELVAFACQRQRTLARFGYA